MDRYDVEDKVEDIRHSAHDGEVAHGLADDLWRNVLQAIADGASNAQELAQEALKVDDITFDRWHA